MKKLFFVGLLLLLIAPVTASAATSSVALNAITLADNIYPNTFDNLLLDFTVTPAVADTLSALAVKNEGSARDFYDINRLVLYSDAGAVGFQGFGVDNELAVGNYDNGSNLWAFSGLNDAVPAGGKRYFVTVETKAGATDGRTFVFNVQAKYDADADGVYDIGDSGFYFNSKTVIPTESLTGGATRLKAQTIDTYKPVVVITNLAEGQSLPASTHKITGKAKDQGGSSPESVEICIDYVCNPATSTGSEFSTWEYNWTGITAGNHSVYARATDQNDNIGVSSTYTVKTATASVPEVTNGDVSTAFSTVTVNKTKALADSIDKISIAVKVKNTDNQARFNQSVYIAEKRATGSVVIKSKLTDANGDVSFDVLSSHVGLFVIRVITPEGVVLKDWFDIEFSKNNIDWTVGRFVKTLNSPAVYLLDSANVRHAYPTASIWKSYFGSEFSKVETISVAEMATYDLGRNVPYKVGTMIKLSSANKVYRVEPDAVIRWITTEDVAETLYGPYWMFLVRDVPDAFFADYVLGEELE